MNEKELIENGFNNLIDTLAHLASKEIQHRFIVHGNKNEYIVPDDILEDISSEMEFFIFKNVTTRMNFLKNKLGESALSSLKELNSFIEENNSFLEKYTFDSLEQLVDTDPVWVKIRKDSNSILELINFNLKQWESTYT